MPAVHLVTSEYPPAIGGVADYAHAIAHGLARAGDEVHVWCAGAESELASNGVRVHRTLGRVRALDLQRTATLLDEQPAPRRLLVQWVPHGYGLRSMNVPFCLWLWGRARKGDRVEIVVHEPFLAFREGSWRQTAAAVVHRLMTAILLQAACRVWVTVPAWESMWKPYTFGRAVPFCWLPVPSTLTRPQPDDVQKVRARLGAERRIVVGHFGTYGRLITDQLDQIFDRLLRRNADVHLLLMGAASASYAESLVKRHPDCANRVTAVGPLAHVEIAAHIAACDVLVQPYPDGISARRTTAMAGLSLGVPIVTTRGYVTEPFWDECGVVRLSGAGDWGAFVTHTEDLARSADERRRLSNDARRFYDRTFDLRHAISALRTGRS